MTDYDAVLDGLVEKALDIVPGYDPTHPYDQERARRFFRAIDAPSLVLLLREAREELVDIRDAYLGPDPSDLIARIDAHPSITPQPSTSPTDV